MTSPTPTLHFEDFSEGDALAFGEYPVTEAEIIDFARTFDPQPFHLDETAAAETLLGGLAASGWHTCAIGMRLIFDGFLAKAASLGAPGIDEVRWLKPVSPGDRLSLTGKVTAARASRSTSDRGIVTFAFALVNQDGDEVMTQVNSIMIGRRPEGAAA